MDSHPAKEHQLPVSSTFYSVEYPGYVSSGSIPLAIENLGGQASLVRAFKRSSTKNEALLELNMRPDNPFSHPIPGDIVGTSNILVKVIKRKLKRPNGEQVGECTVEAVGIIPKTARFRSMVDFQFTPDPNDPVVKLRYAMQKMDAEEVMSYAVPAEIEEYITPIGDSTTEVPTPETHKSNLRLMPPPIFTRHSIPLLYNLKANPMSVVTTVVDKVTGVEKKRLINKSRWKGFGPATISFSEPNVPTTPPPNVTAAAGQADQRIQALLEKFFKERPIWTRQALSNQFSTHDWREIHNSKILLPLTSYVFQDGPWRDTLLKLGYDPRSDPGARFFQRLYFRNLNHPVVRPSIISRRQEGRSATTRVEDGEDQGVEQQQSHIFDGKTLTKEVANFQLCDITDPLLKEMIEDDDGVRDVCNERDGWFTTHSIERIKTVLRHKFFSLLEGYVPTEEECMALLQPKTGSSSIPSLVRDPKRRPGKHNMAKGALPPEDIAAARLRATLESTARENSSRFRRTD